MGNSKWIKRAVVFALLPCSQLFAQASVAAKRSDDELLMLIGLWLFVGLIGIAFILSMVYVMVALLQIQRQLSGETEEAATPVYSLTQAVPIEKEHTIMLDHDYDGIRELDNKLPPWWVAMFYLTIVFGGVYMWYYHMGGSGKMQEEEYIVELQEAEEQMKLMANKVDENSVTLLTDASRIKNGEAIFQKNCVACHGKLGEGGVGPNLTDAYWLHGGDVKSVFKTIKYGVPTKGMIPWQAQLSPAQIQEVTSYIETLKGTNPPNGKEPQGEMLGMK